MQVPVHIITTMALNLHTSNRLDLLARQLAAVVKQPAPCPLAPEVIVVQSRGIQRWLSLRLSRDLGICANCSWPFPNQFFQNTVRSCLPGLPETGAFDREVLTWRLMELLTAMDGAGPAAYLQGDNGLKLYQLACRTADLFDQYAVYRPDMLAAWAAGRLCHSGDSEERWQARLWQSLAAQGMGIDRGRLLEDFLAALARDPALADRLPERVSIFGIAVLPPYHVRFLEALASCREVHLFLLNPCREYWGDILNDKQAVRISRRPDKAGGVAQQQDLHLTRGNSLLAALGSYGREFYELLLASRECVEQELFAPASRDSLLACIQDDILNLRDRGMTGAPVMEVQQNDRSLQVHSCHSPMREVEVLHSALLKFFETSPGLAPHDILVMTPDLETYGPFVQAVFSAPHNEAERIPFSMADRSFLEAYPLYEAMLHLLGIGQSRFEAPRVLELLEVPAVQQRFGLAPGDSELIRGWIGKTRIRWGRNADSRSGEGLPASNDNTWQAGLERLLLGYALPEDGEHLSSGLLPCSPGEGSTAQVLGRLAHFMEALFSLSTDLQGEKTLADWSQLLQNLLARFFLPDSEEENQLLDEARQVCAELGSLQELSSFTGAVKLEIVREHLEQAFARRTTAAGFLTGAVTVCAMLPMRSIPFRIICLLGMNDGSFPRAERPPAFDLIARYSRPCDRSAKKDDRYLFLETLISAEETLFISYTGQNLSDNSVIPPSTLVSQLLDYAGQGFTCPGRTIHDLVCTRHRLQPFSPAYFEGGAGLFSYSLQDYLCAQAISQEGRSCLPLFFPSDLPEPEAHFRVLSIEDLCSFVVNPSRHLLQKRLGLYFDCDEGLIQDREPFALAGLERYALEQDLLARRLAGTDPGLLLPAVRAQGILPHGSAGELAYADCIDRIDAFIGKLDTWGTAASAEPVSADLVIEGFTLTGQLGPLQDRSQIFYRLAEGKPKDFLRAWIYHLALCASGRGDTTLLFVLNKKKEPGKYTFSRPDDPQGLLAGLLELYWQGLRRPLPLFPEAAYAFADQLASGKKTETKAFQRALEAFEGNKHKFGDADDPYVAQCFRTGEFDEEEFADLAKTVYLEMLHHRAAD